MMRFVLTVVAAALALAGCSTSSPDPAPAPTTAAAAASGAEQALLAALGRIDPGLVAKSDRAVSRAKNVCDSFTRYEGDEAKVVDYTRQEFDGGNASVDAAKAKAIVEAVRASGMCKA